MPLPCTSEAAARFPAFAEAPYVDVTVERGDILYLPAFWWHDVQGGAERNITVNYWYRCVVYTPGLVSPRAKP